MSALRRIAATAISVIAIAASMFATVADLPVMTVDGKPYHYYEVQPSETVYSLCNRFGITADELIRYNPSVADGLRAYSVLFFPVEGSDADTPEGTMITVRHIVKHGETVYGLSRQYGLTMDEFVAQNPSTRDGLRTGDALTVTTLTPLEGDVVVDVASRRAAGATPTTSPAPSANVEIPQIITPSETAAHPQSAPQSAPQPATSLPTVEEAIANLTPLDRTAEVTTPEPQSRRVTLAVMLPFMLGEETPSKSAQRFTEFFKGLLVAADTLQMADYPIEIQAYDTAGSLDSVRSILQRPELRRAMAIIAPDDEAQLALIGAYGADNDIMVFNGFVVKDTSYQTNQNMMQANIPHDLMYDMALDGILDRLSGYTPVIVQRAGGPSNHVEFVDALRERWTAEGRTVKELTFTDRLQASDLAPYGSGRWVFIPVTGQQAELNRILPAMVSLKESLGEGSDIALFGYPEWITYRGETMTNMQKIDTTVFSRFYNDTESYDSQALDNTFRRWYGSPAEPAVPRQGLMGFDTGMYLIPALRVNRGDFSKRTPNYQGVQNAFRFEQVEGEDGDGGWVNDALFLVNFRPSGMVSRQLLSR